MTTYSMNSKASAPCYKGQYLALPKIGFKKDLKKLIIDKSKKSQIYQDVLKNFPDAELIDVDLNGKENSND